MPVVEEEKIDHVEALRRVLRTSIPKNGVRRGLRECAQALTRGQARVCLLASNCDEPNIVKLTKALADGNGVPIFEVESREKLGEWVGIAKHKASGEVKKAVKCSVAVITDFGERTRALDVLNEHLSKSKK